MTFVFDLDGTICFKGQPVSKTILRALEQLTNEGHRVIFASARPIRDMLPVLDEAFHHYPMIGGNGSLIYNEGKIVGSQAFSAEDLTEIRSVIADYEATYLIDSEWDYAYTGPLDHPILQNVDPAGLAKLVELNELPSIVKVLLLTFNDFEQVKKRLDEIDIYVNVHRNEHVLDLSPRGISKWSALVELGVEEGKYIAIGNDANDISMFKHALHTVMIGQHELLAPFAKEAIGLEGEYEQRIAERLVELSQIKQGTMAKTLLEQ